MWRAFLVSGCGHPLTVRASARADPGRPPRYADVMTTPQRPASRWRRLAVAAYAAVLLPALLAGCSAQSDEAPEEFAAVLRDSPAVADIEVSITHPWPLTVQAELAVTLEPGVSRESLEDLRALACATEVDASVYLTLEYGFEGGARLLQEHVPRCWDDASSFVEALPALEAHAAEFSSVVWRESDLNGEDYRDIVFDLADPDAVAAAILSDDLLAALPDDTLTSITAGSFDVVAAPVDEGRATAQAVVAVSGEASVARARYHDGLFLELATDAPGSVERVRGFLALTRPGVPVLGVVDSSVEVSGNGIPARAVLDAEALLSAEAVADAVTVSDSGVHVRIASASLAPRIAGILESAGMGDVPVTYSVVPEAAEEPVASFEPGSDGVPLTVRQLDDVETVVEAFLTTGKLGRVDYDPDILRVVLAEDYFDDPAAEEQFIDLLGELIDDGLVTGAYGYANMGNEKVPLG